LVSHPQELTRESGAIANVALSDTGVEFGDHSGILIPEDVPVRAADRRGRHRHDDISGGIVGGNVG
jgi:hypothetical protein